jgi:hypothetical protein
MPHERSERNGREWRFWFKGTAWSATSKNCPNGAKSIQPSDDALCADILFGLSNWMQLIVVGL